MNFGSLGMHAMNVQLHPKLYEAHEHFEKSETLRSNFRFPPTRTMENVRVHEHACAYACEHTCTRKYTHETSIHKLVHGPMISCMHTSKQTNMNTGLQMRKHCNQHKQDYHDQTYKRAYSMHIHTYIHTHTHTRTDSSRCWQRPCTKTRERQAQARKRSAGAQGGQHKVCRQNQGPDRSGLYACVSVLAYAQVCMQCVCSCLLCRAYSNL